jgi:peptidoglycan/xylan/chitin deacetylase (PgdA/CDA1 family)
VVLAAVGLSLCGGLVVVTQPLGAYELLQSIFPEILWRVDTAQPLVGLSFDDGPSPEHTPELLGLLSRHGARATFFLIGTRAAAHPRLVARIRGEGHEVANHYLTDGSILTTSDERFEQALVRTEHLLRLEGARKLFRPPGGLARPSQLQRARSRGYTCVLGSAYPFDPSRPPSAYIRWLVTKNLAPGVIVILHDGIADPSRTLAALDGILAAGTRKGLRFVSVGTLMDASRGGTH